ncbi:putative reverse transcriptase zinc-binding domain-containing protein [Helianthus annuus]|nr:putative reverse transcriptase zinc-binding domain-containing protein [Helianthus annuus]
MGPSNHSYLTITYCSFHICSGLKINIEKSNLYGVGVGSVDIEEMAKVVGCKPERPPFKYLGLMVGANMNRVSNWQPVMEIFFSRLAKWKAHLLSIGGRVVLIKSVLESLPSYYFSLYKAPKKVINDLEALIKKFLWGGSAEERKLHWVAWDKVTRTKKCGGLGLSKLQIVNTSLLAKWGWRFKTERSCLWKEVIAALHSSRVGWECIPFKKSLNGVWNNIAKNFINTKVGGKPLRNFLVGSVGDGKDIAFWLDTWLLNEPLKCVFPELFRLEADKKCRVADRIYSHGSVDDIRWCWTSDPAMVGLQSSVGQLVTAISGTRIRLENDKWRWSSEGDGLFTVKALKKMLKDDIHQDNGFVLQWCNWIPSKVNIHAWRLGMDRVPTALALMKRNIDIGDPVCPLCNSEEESADHVFLACFVASMVWQGISVWCKIPSIFAFSLKDLLSFHIDLKVSDKKRKAVHGVIMVACWGLWRARNGFKFSNATVKIEGIISEIKALSFFGFPLDLSIKGLTGTNGFLL